MGGTWGVGHPKVQHFTMGDRLTGQRLTGQRLTGQFVCLSWKRPNWTTPYWTKTATPNWTTPDWTTPVVQLFLLLLLWIFYHKTVRERSASNLVPSKRGKRQTPAPGGKGRKWAAERSAVRRKGLNGNTR